MSISDHHAMWASLGLDLNAHDQLLEILSSSYQDTFLTQENRPDSMSYADRVMAGIHGQRIKELVQAREDGRVVIGTFCLYVPEELILAVDGICVGLCAGAEIGSDKAEEMVPRNTCALIKSFIGFKLSGLCPYIEAADLVIGETTCDGKKKAYEVFDEAVKTFVIETPNMKTEASQTLWKSEIRRLASEIERVSGRKITAEGLKKGRRLVNAKRAALQRLNQLRTHNPCPISGRDALLVNQIAFYDDPVRFTSNINALCDELEQRVSVKSGAAPANAPRLLMSGCPMAAPNWKLPAIVEKNGAIIVGEESCVGERGTRNLVEEHGETTEEILELIAERYFKIDCACFTPNNERLDHIVEMARKYKADGVLHYSLQFCTPYLVESLRVERRLREEGIPMLKVETDYSQEDIPQLDTRVQAFLEIIKN